MYQVTYYFGECPFIAVFKTLDKALEYIEVQLANGVYIECRHIEDEYE